MKRHIPNTITLCNLICGCIAVKYAFGSQFYAALSFIVAGAVFDFFDGFAAVKNTSEKWGYIDLNGNTALPFDFDSAYSFNEGVARVARGNRYGFIKISETEG